MSSLNGYKIPKLNMGKIVFLTHKSEGRLNVKTRFIVSSKVCPAQVCTGITECKTNFMGFNGKKIFKNIDHLMMMVKDNLQDEENPLDISFKKPTVRIKAFFTWS